MGADFRLGAWCQPYVEFSRPEDVRATVRRAGDAGISLLLPCVKSETHFTDGRSLAYYKTERIYPGADWDMLDSICREAEKSGLEIHAWVCTFLEGKSKLLEKHRDCESMRFDHLHEEVPTGMACPARSEVREAELAVIEEIATRYPVAGVHLDFIRYMELRACACKHCRGKFKKMGFRPEQIFESGGARRAWFDMRTQAISSFVHEAGERVRAHGKMLSAAVFPDYPAIADICGQDWARWLREGWLDFAVTMNYTDSRATFLRRAAEHRALGLPEGRLFEGIAKRTEKVLLDPKELCAQVEKAKGMKAAGAVFFSMGALEEGDVNELRQAN